MYHISDVTKYLRCPRLFMLDREQSRPAFRQFIRMDEQITDLAAEKLRVQNAFTGKRGDDPAAALQALTDREWLVKARFEYHGLRIKVPFLHRSGDVFDLYFLFAGLLPKVSDMTFYSATLWVLEGLGIPLGRIYIIHFNGDYIRGRELDTDALFVVDACFYNDHGNASGDAEELIRSRMRDYDVILTEMDALSEKDIPAPVRTNRCSGRMKCRFYSACFPQEGEEEDNSILFLNSAQYKYLMHDEGRKYLRDADPALLEGSLGQYAQVMADRRNGLFADKEALRSWLGELEYPLTFVDFEWERFAVPPYEGMRPYDVLLFEYSVDVMHEDGRRYHNVFLDVHDDRAHLVRSLLADIPESGSIIAYNAAGAEMIRLEELAEQLPEYGERLRALNRRMKDLQLPFESGIVYDVRMRGQWSLKRIMSMMDDPGYRDLDIRDGMEAVYQWRYLDKETADVDRAKIEEELKAYCGMDSYAMTVVLKWLEGLAEV